MKKPEGKVAVCKCKSGKRSYGVRFEKMSGIWTYTWAFPLKETDAKREGYDTTTIDGMIEMLPGYPGCPYCGAQAFIVCGACGKLGCKNIESGVFTCDWCGESGEIIAYDGAGIKSGNDI